MVLPRIKICCISSIEEARIAISHGANALGLVSAMPSGPGVIEEALIAEIAETVPPAVSTFLLTSCQNAPDIIQQVRTCRVNTVQIVDQVESEVYSELRAYLPGVKLVQVIHVVGEESVEEAETISPYVDAVLLDSGNQFLPVKELGGTGRVHDWRISRRIRERVSRPVFLAGGLVPDNVDEAIRQVSPFGVDVCSGVRTNGRLDEQKLDRFVQRARANWMEAWSR